MKYLTKTGAGLLILALLLTWLAETGFAYIVLLVVGTLDLYLVYKKQQTISQWIQGLWPKKIDYPILVGLSVYTFTMFFKQFDFITGMRAILPLFVFFLLLHFFANEESNG